MMIGSFHKSVEVNEYLVKAKVPDCTASASCVCVSIDMTVVDCKTPRKQNSPMF